MVRTIAWLDGDAPGAEWMASARRIFEALDLTARYETKKGRIGWDSWTQNGKSLPPETIELCRNSAAVLIGTLAQGPDSVGPKEQLSRAAANPAQAREPLRHLAQELGLGVRLVEFRRYAVRGEAFEMALVAPEPGVPEAQAARQAFETARAQSQPMVTVLADRESPLAPAPLAVAARGLAKEFLDVQLRESEVLPYCSGLLEKPGLQGVVLCNAQVASPLLAVGGHLAGGAFGCAVSFRGSGKACFSTLTSAPRAFAGSGRSSPIGTFQALRAMLAYLGETTAATRLEGTIAHLIAEGPKTSDQGGDASTEHVTFAALAHLGNREQR